MPGKILITGGTGLLGTRLTQVLQQKGYKVVYLSRTASKVEDLTAYAWDVKNQTIDPEALDNVDAIIHLAGAGIADKKWTKERKKVILKSRTASTQLLNKALTDSKNNVKTVISASAIGYYGYDGGGVLKKEESRFGDDFLATVTKEWEAEVDQLPEFLRTVKLRLGIILSEKGGALAELVKPVKLGLGAPIGSGDQYMSWIHIDDVCNMFIHAIENASIEGVYNAVAPNPVTNKELTKTAAKALDKPCFLPPVPPFILKMMLGERASMVLGGSKISSEKIQSTGFKYQFEEIRPALEDLLKV